ncbi:MAG: type II secretion system protein [Salinisphaeraceae bacterium]
MIAPRHQAGFTLVELLIATTIAVVLAAASAQVIIPEYREQLTDRTSAQVYTIQEAAQSYYVDEGEWPDQPGGCANAINVLRTTDYLIGINQTSPWATNYATDCPGTADRFEVAVDIPEPYAGVAANTLIDSLVVGANDRVRSSVPVPDAVGSTGEFLSRVDTGDPQDRTMEADILMGNNSIQNADDIETNTVTASGLVSAGAVDSNGGIIRSEGGTINSGGGQVRTQGGTVVTSGGNVNTNNGDVNTSGGNVNSGGGNFNSNGGDLNLNGGDALGVGEVRFVNGARILPQGGNNLRIAATSTSFDGDVIAGDDIQVGDDLFVGDDGRFGGVVEAQDFVTPDGKSLQRSVQDVGLYESGEIVQNPTCPGGLTPRVEVAPIFFEGGPSQAQAEALGSVQAVASPVGGNRTRVELFLVDAQGFREAKANHRTLLAISKCD